MEQQETVQLDVQEDKDGGVVVSHPDGEDPVETFDERLKSGGSDLDADARRQRNREDRERKKARRDERIRESTTTIQTQSEQIASLRAEIQALRSRTVDLDRRTIGQEAVQFDKSLEDTLLEQKYYEDQRAKAMADQDAARFSEADRKMSEARDRARQLAEAKAQHEAAAKNRLESASAPAADDEVKARATVWAGKNKWFDPQLKDRDSQIVKQIDNLIAAKGIDPKSDSYWEEMDRMIGEQLPHRKSGGTTRRNDADEGERVIPAVVTGSGREDNSASVAGEFRLSREKWAAIREAAGDDKAMQDRLIKRYLAQEREQRRSA